MYQEIPFDTDWLFAPGSCLTQNDDAFVAIDLPHSPVMFTPSYREEGAHCSRFTYRKHLDLHLKEGESATLRFEGIANRAQFFIDGSEIAESRGAYLPCIVELANRNACVLTILVDAAEDPSFPPFGNTVDYLTFCGIYRTVTLIIHEETMFTFLGLDSPTSDCVILKGRAVNSDHLPVEAVLYDGTTRLGKAGTKVAEGRFTLRLEHLSLETWSVDRPRLYTLEVRLGEKDCRRIRFGSRTAKFTKDGFLLNGKPLFLVGLNRHQDFPYLGYAASASLQREDVVQLKALGINLVRTSHYPQDPSFLDACDELGLLVFEEIPGWQHIGDSQSWRQACLDAVKQMIERDYNHPSIILWGVRINESMDDDALYQPSNELAHALDETRMTGGVRNFRHSHLLEDVYTFNDFSYAGKGRALLSKRSVCKTSDPYLVTECMGHMFPVKTYDGPQKRAEHALRYYQILEDAHRVHGLSGVIGWCMHDYFTHADFGSGDQICHHGVLDLYRNEKAAASVFSSQREEPKMVCLLSSLDGGDFPNAMLDPLLVATNCEQVRLSFDGVEVGTFSPDGKHYAHLAHPPLFISDLIGGRLQQERYLHRWEYPFLARLLAKVGRQGGKLTVFDTLKMGLFLGLHHLKYADAVALFSKYVGNWGSAGGTWKLEGLVGGVVAATETICATIGPVMELESMGTTLSEEFGRRTMARIRVRIRRPGQSLALPYAFIPYTVDTNELVQLVSPKQDTTLGGSAAIFVRTKGLKGEAVVRVHSRLGDKEVRFTVV